MVRLEDVSVRLGRTDALRSVSLSAARGEVVGLVGPNGAGKTTALRVLAGFLGVDRGRAEVGGVDLAHDRLAALAQVGYLPEAVPLHDEMRVDDYLDFRARLKGVARGERRARIADVIERFGLGERRRSVIGRLSKGLRQRVGLCDALLARPAVLLLDEPTTGLDPGQLAGLRALVAALGGEHTVVLSSHALGELEQVAGRWVVLAGGRVVGDGTPAALRAGLGLPVDAPLDAVYLGLIERAAAADPAGGAGSGGAASGAERAG
jgi:ABC-2 type transport system ATP-binding protein